MGAIRIESVFMETQSYDVIIVGQGLAGTALAWALGWSGARVLIVDRDAAGTSSKIAAGLITPITGQRLVVSWRLAELWSAAVAFYRRVEQATQTEFFRQTPMIRFLATDVERARFFDRTQDLQFRALVRFPPEPLARDDAFIGAGSAFEMVLGGQLDVPVYLRASRRAFLERDSLLTADLDFPSDLVLDAEAVRLPRLNVAARRIVFCQGVDAMSNPWFRKVQFKPAKGELLTLRIPGLQETRIVHRGIWLARMEGDHYRAGATYEWRQLDNRTTPEGRFEIESRLQEFLRLPYQVVDHTAAVRPIHRNQYPVAGIHPDEPRLSLFNGLGSKGVLQAPFFAHHLVRVLAGDEVLDAEIDINLKTDLRGCRP